MFKTYLIGFLVVFSSFGYAAEEPIPAEWTAQLVQSVPTETGLTQTGMSQTLDVWLDLIRSSRFSLDLAQFYVSAQTSRVKDRAAFEKILVELENAGKRGVTLRFLIAAQMAKEDSVTLARLKKIKNAQVRLYNLAQLTRGVHHAKYWISDGKTIFIGSQNFDWRSLNQIHELGVRLQDDELGRQLSRIFELDWKIAQTEKIPETLAPLMTSRSPSEKRVELVASPASLNPSEIRPAIQALVEMIDQAKKTIQVQLLDYTPVSPDQTYWPTLDNALRAAALRKVKIEMIVAKSNTTFQAMDFLKSLAWIPGIEIRMVTIPKASDGEIPFARVIHSKYMIVDGESLWIGTSNWSKGYFYNSRNIELIFRKSELAPKAQQVFTKLWNYSFAEKIR